MMIKNKFAIGCIVQWYEVQLVEEYLQSVKQAIDKVENKKDIIIDLYFNTDQSLEKIDENQISISSVRDKYYDILEKVFGYDRNFFDCANYNLNIHGDETINGLYTIADYRMDFDEEKI